LIHLTLTLSLPHGHQINSITVLDHANGTPNPSQPHRNGATDAHACGQWVADLVAFGRPYIANPDLAERLATDASLHDVDWTTVNASGPNGYIDFAALGRAEA
jgi:2,4-dienoyl-CoA reductase-like NADH-dependent reductase (Old Yellow Enzyme family)